MGRLTRYSGFAAVLLLSVATLVGGCQTTDPLAPPEPTVDRPPIGDRMTVRKPFDEVWPELLEIIRERGYTNVERDRETVSEVYQTQVEVEDQPRDKVLRERVDEGRGRVSATTDDQRQVAFTLVEEHGWDTGTLSLLLGGDERRYLDHNGVEVSVDESGGDSVDRAESIAVLDALEARFADRD